MAKYIGPFMFYLKSLIEKILNKCQGRILLAEQFFTPGVHFDWSPMVIDNSTKKILGFLVIYCQIPVLGLGLGVDFTFAWNKKKNNNDNKTWSLVSNSSFSKTFALCSLENLKFRSFVLTL